MTQAENERDPYAIPALKKCLELDPNNLIALMALAVSYTNENLQLQACHTLKAWLNANPKYSDLLEADYTSMKAISPSFISGTYLKDVQDLFIMAARRNPKNDLDPDVQCGLGVLFNLSDECDKAADCFKTALLVKSDDVDRCQIALSSSDEATGLRDSQLTIVSEFFPTLLVVIPYLTSHELWGLDELAAPILPSSANCPNDTPYSWTEEVIILPSCTTCNYVSIFRRHAPTVDWRLMYVGHIFTMPEHCHVELSWLPLPAHFFLDR
uniref:Uncharacterized protein n=1 Tax=Timema tahoe TaxID=61484 RepID=A0A7R9INL1_9NEOP|nr:unnamed protein product [Timema tahoe]